MRPDPRVPGRPEPLARERFAAARVARLATTTADGRPHLVPVVFALVRDTVWSAVDGKPKSTRALRRLDNIRANPRVSLLVDHYDEDWATLWWVRVDGEGSVEEAGSPYARSAVDALMEKYPQYAHGALGPPAGPFVRVTVTAWTSWSAT